MRISARTTRNVSIFVVFSFVVGTCAPAPFSSRVSKGLLWSAARHFCRCARLQKIYTIARLISAAEFTQYNIKRSFMPGRFCALAGPETSVQVFAQNSTPTVLSADRRLHTVNVPFGLSFASFDQSCVVCVRRYTREIRQEEKQTCHYKRNSTYRWLPVGFRYWTGF